MESILKKILKLNTYYYIAVSDEEIILSNEHAYYKTPFVPGAALCAWKDILIVVCGINAARVDSDIFGLEGEMVELSPLTEEFAKELYARTIAHTIHWFGEQSKTIGSSVMIQCEYDTRKNKVTILAGFENDVMLLLLQISQID